MNGKETAESMAARWKEMDAQMEEISVKASAETDDPERAKVQEALNGLFEELKRLSKNAQELVETAQNKKEDK